MLEIRVIREEKDRVIAGLKKRNFNDGQLSVLDDILRLDEERRAAQGKLDNLLSQRNKLSRDIGQMMQAGKREEAEKLKTEVADLKAEAETENEAMNRLRDELEAALLNLPNVPNDLVPAGRGPEENEIYRDFRGELPLLDKGAKPHWDLAEEFNLIDFKLGATITGSGFPLFRGNGARLERALINFFLNEASEAGYEEIIPPLLVNAETARGTGQLPDKEGQMYFVEKDVLYLIPTAEVPLTNMYRDKILREDELPVRLAGYTPCFRREAGSYGSDVKGLNRVHQFDKVEIVNIEHPEKSYQTLNGMLDHVAGLLDKLGLPYRILRLCGGDMGFTSALTYDFEVYAAAQQKWLEVSSVSNFETFQSNRMKMRFRDENGNVHLAHTLNGSALALARIVAAILENNQSANGISIPEALQPYTGFSLISHGN